MEIETVKPSINESKVKELLLTQKNCQRLAEVCLPVWYQIFVNFCQIVFSLRGGWTGQTEQIWVRLFLSLSSRKVTKIFSSSAFPAIIPSSTASGKLMKLTPFPWWFECEL